MREWVNLLLLCGSTVLYGAPTTEQASKNWAHWLESGEVRLPVLYSNWVTAHKDALWVQQGFYLWETKQLTESQFLRAVSYAATTPADCLKSTSPAFFNALQQSHWNAWVAHWYGTQLTSVQKIEDWRAARSEERRV